MFCFVPLNYCVALNGFNVHLPLQPLRSRPADSATATFDVVELARESGEVPSWHWTGVSPMATSTTGSFLREAPRATCLIKTRVSKYGKSIWKGWKSVGFRPPSYDVPQ